MDLFSLSINHRTAPIDVREKIWFSDQEIRKSLQRIKEEFFGECVLFSTCNRTEVYGAHLKRDVSGGEVRRFLIDCKKASKVVKPDHFARWFSREAVQHLFSVSGGIDSMVIGDIQILNQVKTGFQLAREEGALGPVLNRLMQSSLRVGKRARSETTICEGAVSISYAAVELASKIFADLSSKTALLIGAGKTGELTVKHLVSKGIGNIRIANRTRSKAEGLVAAMGGEVVPFDRFIGALGDVDIAVTSINSDEPVLRSADMESVMRSRQKKPIFLIDLGVPRNIDPAIRRIDNVFLYDLDSLGSVVERNLGQRKSEIPRVEGIIREEAESFSSWYNSLQVGPTIHDLKETIEAIREEEVLRNRNRFRTEDRELLEIVTKRIVNKILHQPITSLKQHTSNGAARGEVIQRIQTLREIFGLPDENRQDAE